MATVNQKYTLLDKVNALQKQAIKIGMNEATRNALQNAWQAVLNNPVALIAQLDGRSK